MPHRIVKPALFGWACYEMREVTKHDAAYFHCGVVWKRSEAKQWLLGKTPKSLRGIK